MGAKYVLIIIKKQFLYSILSKEENPQVLIKFYFFVDKMGDYFLSNSLWSSAKRLETPPAFLTYSR